MSAMLWSIPSSLKGNFRCREYQSRLARRQANEVGGWSAVAIRQETLHCRGWMSWGIVVHSRTLDSSWNVMAHGDAREWKWRGNWRMEWVIITIHTTSEHDVSSITTADAHTSASSSRLNWRPRRFKWTRPFRRKTKSGFCACAITFQLASTYSLSTTSSSTMAFPLLGS